MIKGIYYISLLLVSMTLFGQGKGAIGIEVNANYHQFSMTEFNRAVSLRRESFDPSVNVTKATDVNDGTGFGLSFHYQLLKSVSLGVYSSYSVGNSRTELNFVTGGDFGTPIDTNYVIEHHDLRRLSVGFMPQLYFNKFDFWGEIDFLKRIEAVFCVEVGYSFGRADLYSTNPKEEAQGIRKEFNNVSGTHLQTMLKIGYKLMDQNFFSTIGFSFGYQYLKTNQLKGEDYNKYFFSAGNTPELDFSGFSAGIYLTLGK